MFHRITVPLLHKIFFHTIYSILSYPSKSWPWNRSRNFSKFYHSPPFCPVAPNLIPLVPGFFSLILIWKDCRALDFGFYMKCFLLPGSLVSKHQSPGASSTWNATPSLGMRTPPTPTQVQRPRFCCVGGRLRQWVTELTGWTNWESSPCFLSQGKQALWLWAQWLIV